MTATIVSPPETSISNGLIRAGIYLPDAENGYYRSTRFDWSGIIHSLSYEGHEYFGEWQESDDPYLHDRITGPVDSFGVLQPAGNAADAAQREAFVAIGIGVCAPKAGEDSPGSHPYRILDHGRREVSQGANWIEFEQTITDAGGGYGYIYKKRLTLVPGAAELVIDYTLANTGAAAIVTDVYNHNFFVIDGQPSGPDFVVRFPFEAVVEGDLGAFATVKGRELVYLQEVPEGKSIMSFLRGFAERADQNGFAIENRKTKAGVRMATDRALAKLNYWSPATTLCPEPFIDLDIPPGHADRWSCRYQFYQLD